jgi:hypothetical protein
MLGNNQRSAKVKSIQIPLEDTSISGKWFLPENPELEKKTIVGISASFSGSSGDIAQNLPFYSGAEQQIVLNKNQSLSKSSFLTLYAADGSEMVSNFPLNPLFNDNGNKKNRIVPVTGKIKVRKSYIFIEGNKIPPANRVVVIWLNFFYL